MVMENVMDRDSDMPDITNDIIIERIPIARKRLKKVIGKIYRQEDLAQDCDVPTHKIQSIEDGRMKMLRVNMDIHQIDGFSGHSDRGEITNFFRELSPKPERVVLIHGQRNKSQSLAQHLSKRYHVKVDVPRNLETLRFN